MERADSIRFESDFHTRYRHTAISVFYEKKLAACAFSLSPRVFSRAIYIFMPSSDFCVCMKEQQNKAETKLLRVFPAAWRIKIRNERKFSRENTIFLVFPFQARQQRKTIAIAFDSRTRAPAEQSERIHHTRERINRSSFKLHPQTPS